MTGDPVVIRIWIRINPEIRIRIPDHFIIKINVKNFH